MGPATAAPAPLDAGGRCPAPARARRCSPATGCCSTRAGSRTATRRSPAPGTRPSPGSPPATAAEAGVKDGDVLAVTGPAGSVELPLQVTQMPDRVVWLPLNSVGRRRRSPTPARSPVTLVTDRPRPTRAPAPPSTAHGGASALNRQPLTPSPPRTCRCSASDPWWLIVIKAVFCFAFLMVTVLFSIVWERKVVAWMQLRIGPNRHGPWGMLQSLADGMKLMLKEDVVVKRADKVVYVLAPIVAAIPAFMAIAVIPFGPAGNEVSIFGHRTAMQLTDLPIAMLYILATASVGIYGIVLAGWSSGSTYPLLGGLRSCAQMISYEIAMGLGLRRGLPLLRVDVDLGDRRARSRTAGTSCCCRSRS